MLMRLWNVLGMGVMVCQVFVYLCKDTGMGLTCWWCCDWLAMTGFEGVGLWCSGSKGLGRVVGLKVALGVGFDPIEHFKNCYNWRDIDVWQNFFQFPPISMVLKPKHILIYIFILSYICFNTAHNFAFNVLY